MEIRRSNSGDGSLRCGSDAFAATMIIVAQTLELALTLENKVSMETELREVMESERAYGGSNMTIAI
ncbi:hypothetical protein E2542_SST00754 [Spatholobus suberectus]|nr:hypothetical protein E2542_SST00754 [Spatholobus suberectus]